MRIAVLGPTGFGGGNLAIELLNRGHNVVGISRNPTKLGRHEHYEPRELNLEKASIAELIKAFEDVEVVVNAYNPPYGPNVYRTFVETVRRFVIAGKASKHLKYFISIGGTGSLYPYPSDHTTTACDVRSFWLAYRHAVADAETATYHMEERIGFDTPGAKAMRSYRNARKAILSGQDSEDDKKIVEEAEKAMREGDDFCPDIPLAARASYSFFDGDRSWPWTFVSPPARYVPGPRTGKYGVVEDVVPLADGEGKDGNEFDGRLLGISAADLAVAIADEIERKEKVHGHWSAVGEVESEGQYSSYARLK